MEIRIGKYTLRSDQWCAWLEEDFKNEKGKTSRRRITGYYRNFDLLLRDFINTRTKDNEATEVKEVLKIIEEARKDAVKIAQAAVKEDFRIMRGKKE